MQNSKVLEESIPDSRMKYGLRTYAFTYFTLQLSYGLKLGAVLRERRNIA
jgi:hypothetical protein